MPKGFDFKIWIAEGQLMKILFLLNLVRLVGSLARVSKIAVEQEIIPICNQMATWVAVGENS